MKKKRPTYSQRIVAARPLQNYFLFTIVLLMVFVGAVGFYDLLDNLDENFAMATVGQSPDHPTASTSQPMQNSELLFRIKRHYTIMAVAVVAICVFWLLSRASHRHPGHEDHHDLDHADHLSAAEILSSRQIYRRQHLFQLLSGSPHHLPTEGLLVRHMMSTKLQTVDENVSGETVKDWMTENKMRHMLVCREDGVLVGVISDRDFAHRDGRTASHIMTHEPLTVTENTPVDVAITVMHQKHIGALPVVDEQHRLRGLLTRSDLLIAFQAMIKVLQADCDHDTHGHVAAPLMSDVRPQQTPVATST